MREFRSAALVLVLLLAVAALANAQPEGLRVTISKEAFVSDDYIVVRTKVVSPQPLVRISFNVSSVKGYLVAAYTKAGDKKLPARLEGDLLVFSVPGMSNEVELVEVYAQVMSYTPDAIRVKVPLTLSPVGIPADVKVKVIMPTVDVQAVSPKKLNITREGDVYIEGAVEGGNTTVIELAMPPTTKILVISRLERLVVIESGGYAVFYDNLTLVDRCASKTEYLFLELPAGVEIIEVRGPLGPYPHVGPLAYTVRSTGNETINVRIRLRAPPFKYGDKTSITIVYRVNLTREDGAVFVPVYSGVGQPISNYTVTLKIRGKVSSIEPQPVASRSTNGWVEIVLPDVGPLFSDLRGGVSLSGLKVEKPGPPIKAIVAAILLVVLGIAIGFVHKRMAPPGEEAVAEARAAPRIVRIARERVELLEGVLSAWDSYSRGKITWQTYKQRVSSAWRRESTLAKEARRELSSGEYGARVESLVSEIDERVGAFKKTLKELEKTVASYRRGIITKEEYKSRISRLVRALEEELDKAYRAAASLEAA